jgi:2-amino-4-hydroxy-6-hydroxymethyldihydropteridine diphosphokinase
MNQAYIGIGSNIEPETNIPKSLKIISSYAKILAISSLWHTEPIGTIGAPFLNASLLVETEYSLHHFKEDVLCSIEARMGRVRTADKNASRLIDLDILIFNDEVQDEMIFSRDHLIFPLAELIPGIQNPATEETLAEIASTHATSTSAYKFGVVSY